MIVAVPQEVEAWMQTQNQCPFIGDMLRVILRKGGITQAQLDMVTAQRDRALAAAASKVAPLPEDTLAVMRTVYGAFDTLDSVKHAATVAMLDGFTVAQLHQVRDADIRHVSQMAGERL